MPAGRPSGLRPLDAEIYRMYRDGKRDREIVGWLRSQGHQVDRTTVLRARQRAEREAALGAPVTPAPARELPEVEVTDDMILSTVLRDLAYGYNRAKLGGDERIKLEHAKRIAELAVARVRIRVAEPQRPVAPGLVQPQPQPEPQPAEDLVRFN